MHYKEYLFIMTIVLFASDNLQMLRELRGCFGQTKKRPAGRLNLGNLEFTSRANRRRRTALSCASNRYSSSLRRTIRCCALIHFPKIRCPKTHHLTFLRSSFLHSLFLRSSNAKAQNSGNCAPHRTLLASWKSTFHSLPAGMTTVPELRQVLIVPCLGWA